MGACGGGYGSLDPAFADRVELELVYRELRELVAVPPSREVFAEEHRRASAHAGRRLGYRDTLGRLLAAGR